MRKLYLVCFLILIFGCGKNPNPKYFVKYGWNYVRKENICPKCGKYELDKYCADCGTKQSEFYVRKKCPKCGENTFDEFCDNCGTRTEYFKKKR